MVVALACVGSFLLGGILSIAFSYWFVRVFLRKTVVGEIEVNNVEILLEDHNRIMAKWCLTAPGKQHWHLKTRIDPRMAEKLASDRRPHPPTN